MKNIPVDGYEAKNIGQQIEKVLRGLGSPDPPLNLDDVRELLRLDRQYYSSSDSSFVLDIVSRLKVAGKQILGRPMILWDAIKKADLSALYLPDGKRILIDASKPKLKHRWNEAHEIGHSIIPWHAEMNLGDTDVTLNVRCHEVIEAEANYAAGQLLFLQEKFVVDASDCLRTLASVRSLAKRYGNTVTSTLWRYVESANPDTPAVGIVSQHPRYPNEEFNPAHPCKHCVLSSTFRRQFSRVTERQLFALIHSYCGFQRRGPLGEADLVILDDSGKRHEFHFESFHNTYEVLSLGVYRRKVPVTVAV